MRNPSRMALFGHAGGLGQHGGGIVGEFERGPDKRVIELVVGVWGQLAAAQMEFGTVAESCSRGHDHLRAVVQPGDIKTHLVEHFEDQAGAAAYFEQLVPASGPAREHGLEQPRLAIKGEPSFRGVKPLLVAFRVPIHAFPPGVVASGQRARITPCGSMTFLRGGVNRWGRTNRPRVSRSGCDRP